MPNNYDQQHRFTKEQLQQAAELVPKLFGYGGKAGVYMISVEYCQSRELVREVDIRIVEELLRLGNQNDG